MSTRTLCLPAALFLALGTRLARQSYSSCPAFWKEDIHKKFDCIGALFSASPAHLTFSGIPPNNGLPLGVAVETKTHYVSPGTRLPDLNIDDPGTRPDTGYLSLTDVLLAGAVSTNQSWYATGSFSWLPPLHYRDIIDNGVTYHKLGPLKTRQVFGIQLYSTHRSVKDVSLYGEGAQSGTTEYAFKLSETYTGAIARLPLTPWLAATGQIEYRQVSLPADNDPLSVQHNFSEATAPGLYAQPGFMHYVVGASTDAMWLSEPASPKETVVPNPNAPQPCLMKHRIVFRLQNRAGYSWYQDLDTGHYSFRQLAFTGDESMHFGGVFQKYFDDKSHPAAFPFLRFVCGGTGHGKGTGAVKDAFKKDDVCDLGQFDFKTRFVISQTSQGNIVPFYYQPTLGGSDIESNLTLRGYPDYRFRGTNLALMQIEYSKPVPAIDPVGILAFYDAGSVALPGQSYHMVPFRQDGGLGETLRLRGNIMFQAYAAMGAGHGVQWGYNLAKLF